MAPKILQTFLPWILYFVIAGSSDLHDAAAALVGTAATIVFNYQGLQKRLAFDWSTLCYFVLLSVLYWTSLDQWLSRYGLITSNAALALIMWSSICTGKPFTRYYLEQQVSEIVRETFVYKRINYIVASVWALLFTFIFFNGFFKTYYSLPPLFIIDFILAVFLMTAVWFTRWFPNWYQGWQFKKVSQCLEDITLTPYLNGNYAPVNEELFLPDLLVEGELPTELTGIYMRNGPNPAFHPISYTYPLDGDGMLHAIYINNGKVSYRNRYVNTKGLVMERQAGRALYSGIAKLVPVDPRLVGKSSDPGPFKNGAFIHIIYYANRYLALWEGGAAYEISPQLQTIGEWSPFLDNSLFKMNAHTKLDPSTQELYTFTYNFTFPYLTYSVLNQKGELIKKVEVEKPYPTMIHDFVLTENYIIFFDCPMIFNLKAEVFNSILSWEPKIGVRIGVYHRKTGQSWWIEEAAFFVFHFVNGYEIDNLIIIDFVRYQEFPFTKKSDTENIPLLYRAIIDCTDNTIKFNQLYDLPVEFPRINENFLTKNNRYTYALTKTSKQIKQFNALLRYDRETGTSVLQNFGEDAELGEAVFAANPSSLSEEDGYLMFFVYNKTNDKSDFVVINAKEFTSGPQAIVKLPRRVPHGLHGSWISGHW